MIELKEIKKTYLVGRSEYPVLKGIDLEIEEGEFVALMGPSGSGKTTLLSILGCIMSPTSVSTASAGTRTVILCRISR